MNTIDAIFIIAREDKEPVRCQRLREHLASRGIPAEKIHFCAPTWGSELTSEEVFKYYEPYPDRPVPCFTYKGHALTKPEISLALNFWAAVDKAIAMGTRRVITFESDVILRPDFCQRLGEALNQRDDWDYVSLSDGVGTHAERPDRNQSFYAPSGLFPAPNQWCFRTTDSMLFKTDYLRRLRQTAFPLREALDWELNYQNMLNAGRAFWIEPHVIEQQTCKGVLVSSLQG